MAYVKLFSSILDSTVWDHDPATKVVWVTMLAMADRDGVVEASVPGLAKRAGVDRTQCERALAMFMAPDPDSRTRDFEGRRVEEIDGGWVLLNYEKYRDKLSAEEAKFKAAERQRRYRERRKRNARNVTRDAGDVSLHWSRDVTDSSPSPSPPAPELRERARGRAPEAAAPPTHTPVNPSWDLYRRLAHAWDESEGLTLSATARAALGASVPRIERLAGGRDLEPVEWFTGACRRFKAHCRDQGKALPLTTLLSQLDQWADVHHAKVDHTVASSHSDHEHDFEEQRKNLPAFLKGVPGFE